MMKKLTLLIIALAYTLVSWAQVTRQDENFKTIPVIKNKIVFLKEVKLQEITPEEGYTKLKEWARENYGRDPFISSVRYDDDKSEIVAKSRIELVLPENSQRIREKVVMRFRVDGFIFEDKCVLEISELSFLHDTAKDKNLPRFIRAEDFITDDNIAIEDDLQELKINLRKSTLYFLNTLGKDFEECFGY